MNLNLNKCLHNVFILTKGLDHVKGPRGFNCAVFLRLGVVISIPIKQNIDHYGFNEHI